jgi:hypothetical protein
VDAWPVEEPGRGSASVAAPVDGSFGVEGGDAGSWGVVTWGACTSGAGRDGVLGTSTGGGGRLGAGGRSGAGGKLGVGGSEGTEGSC